ncbi:MAG TPA: hypothetical protein VHY84_14760 [Bryobacteraceae bacterium]|jgi:hypothetical protein|nr:hypothetical protein [Bryobacteraceae bacterium]
MRSGARRNSESGFAVLFIYAMAATVAIMLFMELPRVAFEAQRDREQLLIDRGEQYTRAVTLFVRKFNRFPPDMDALQNTQNLRFLRRNYIDPMTDKDDWRLIHVGTGGVFTDSLVYNKNKQNSEQFAQQNFITEIQQTGGNQGAATQGVNIGMRQRPSDQPGAPGDPNQPQQPGQIQSGFPQPGLNQPGLNQLGQIQPGFPQTGVPQPGFPQVGGQQFDANGQPISTAPPNPGNAPFPNQVPPNGNGFTGGTPGVQTPQNPFFGGVPGQQATTTFGQQPTQQPGQPVTGANPGTSLINQLLTTPRPGGLNGLLGGAPPSGADQFGNPINGAANNVSTGGLNAPAGATPTPTPGVAAPQVIGGGLAGVASKYEQEGIKVYKDQTSYNKWEFVYDITKDPTRGGGTVPQAAAPANGTTAMPNSFAPQSSSPFGTGTATTTPPPPPAAPTQTPTTPQ